MLIGLFGIAVDKLGRGLDSAVRSLVVAGPEYQEADVENASTLIQNHPEMFAPFIKASGEPVVVKKIARNLYDLYDRGQGYSMKDNTVQLARLIANRLG